MKLSWGEETVEILLLVKIKLILFVLSILSIAYFAGAEIALTSTNALTFSALKNKHPRNKRWILLWEEHPNEILASILIGTNLSMVGAAVVGSSIALDLSAPGGLKLSYEVIAFIASIVVITITLFFGELIPKIASRYFPERVSLLVLPILGPMNRVVYPISRFLIRISEKLIWLFDRKKSHETPFIRPEELKVLLLNDETLPLSNPARNIISNIIDFRQTRISKIMVPRTEIQAVDLNQSAENVIEQIIEKGFSRIPVYRGSIDNIVGIIYSKDVILAWRDGTLFLLEDLLRPVYFVPSSAKIDHVLREFKKGHQHMAIVVDEFGSTVGLATIEDIVEEIVGEIWDESDDVRAKGIFSMPDNSYLIKATETLSKVNRELKLSLPSQEFATMSGWVLDLFGKIPHPGEKVIWGELEVEIIDADKRKVREIQIKKIENKNSKII